ncbi:MAG TPA: sulfatase-like hydrolase/transferase [Fibrobacteria bacterium]|nr:sulfatase-like hydrolase/transferase [Fibrobacteria bacterium]
MAQQPDLRHRVHGSARPCRLGGGDPRAGGLAPSGLDLSRATGGDRYRLAPSHRRSLAASGGVGGGATGPGVASVPGAPSPSGQLVADLLPGGPGSLREQDQPPGPRAHGAALGQANLERGADPGRIPPGRCLRGRSWPPGFPGPQDPGPRHAGLALPGGRGGLPERPRQFHRHVGERSQPDHRGGHARNHLPVPPQPHPLHRGEGLGIAQLPPELAGLELGASGRIRFWRHRQGLASRIVPRRAHNDLGVDDSLLLDSLGSVLAAPGRFFGVIQFNSNHGPFWPGPTRTDLPYSSRERYQASVTYVDRIHARILERLQADPRWDSTFVFLVSDHGENIGARKIGRINSFYEESIRIPFAVRIPPAFADSSARANLTGWTSRPVQLVDLMTTLLDLWRIPTDNLRELVSGASLLAPPVENRVMGGQNTGEIRSWDVEGLYLLRGHWKFVLSEGRAPGLFDLSRDPREESSLWDSLAVRASQLPWLREAMRDPLRQGVCLRAGQWCPVELQAP